MPMLFRNIGSYYTKGYAPVDVAMVTVSPMDKHGNFSFGLTNCATGEIICSGSKELYDFLDENISVASAPISYVNSPDIIRSFRNFVSINGCIAVDLFGQVCSETAGLRQISGTGGQLDFVTGAYDSECGMAILAMASTFTDKSGNVKSRVMPHFTGGDIITTPRTQAQYIATEYGIVNLSGLPTWQRAEKIISIAHPDFREGLIKAAEAQHIWRQSNKR